MKLKQALELGKICGLETPEECVNNVITHAMQLFYWPDIQKEIDELIEDAKRHGVKFCKCGHADVEEKKLCCICEKLAKLR